VPNWATDIWMRYALSCFEEAGGYLVWVRPGENLRALEGHRAQGLCDREIRFEGVVSDALGGGAWRINYLWGEDQTKPAYSLHVLYRGLTWLDVGDTAPAVPDAQADPNL
jgi:hypothetical protein